MLRIFIQRANDQKCLNVLSIEMFFEIKQERKKKRNTQVQLCGLGHYLQKPPMKLTPAYKFGFPFLSYVCGQSFSLHKQFRSVRYWEFVDDCKDPCM